jgi:hypothetical protein
MTKPLFQKDSAPIVMHQPDLVLLMCSTGHEVATQGCMPPTVSSRVRMFELHVHARILTYIQPDWYFLVLKYVWTLEIILPTVCWL